MASQPQPVTPVRVPKAAAAYTPQTQDPDLRSQINTVLLRDGHIEKIQHTLHHALHAHPSNWPAKVAAHALDLLRSGEYTTFPKLMERVLEDVRRDTEAARALHPGGAGAGPNAALGTSTGQSKTDARTKGKLNGTAVGAKGNGNANAKGKAATGMAVVNGVVDPEATTAANGALVPLAAVKADLAMPQTVVEEGIKVTRECLELVCEIV